MHTLIWMNRILLLVFTPPLLSIGMLIMSLIGIRNNSFAGFFLSFNSFPAKFDDSERAAKRKNTQIGSRFSISRCLFLVFCLSVLSVYELLALFSVSFAIPSGSRYTHLNFNFIFGFLSRFRRSLSFFASIDLFSGYQMSSAIRVDL